jgi:hypothetical protein
MQGPPTWVAMHAAVVKNTRSEETKRVQGGGYKITERGGGGGGGCGACELQVHTRNAIDNLCEFASFFNEHPNHVTNARKKPHTVVETDDPVVTGTGNDVPLMDHWKVTRRTTQEHIC